MRRLSRIVQTLATPYGGASRSAAGGGCSEASEWQRSKNSNHEMAKNFSGTATGEVPTQWAERVGQRDRCGCLQICSNAPSQSALLTAPPQGGAKLGVAFIQDCTDPCLSLWENRVMDVYITSLCPHHTAAMTAALAALSAARICSRVGSAIKGTVSMAWRTSRGMS